MTDFIFFSSSQFGLPLLQKLQENFHLKAVISQPDKPQGRKQILTPTPISLYAQQHNLPLYTPEALTSSFIAYLPSATFGFLFAYGKLIPPNLINFFPKGIINLHPSLLPKYRGPSPVRTAIMECQEETGYSLMLLEEKLDSGPILYQEQVLISPTDNWQTLTKKIINHSLSNLIHIINNYLNKRITPLPQDHSQASYTQKINHQKAFLKAELAPHQAECFIRAMAPSPLAHITVRIKGEDKELKIHRAKVSKNLLQPEIVQLEGKNPVTWKQFLEGYPQAKFSYPHLAYLQ